MPNLTHLTIIHLFTKPESALRLTLTEWASVILILRHHQLLARLYFVLLNHTDNLYEALPEYARHHLKNAAIISKKQSDQVFFEASELLSTLNRHTQSIIFLKGAGYTLSNQTVGHGRIYSDIDLLVEKSAINTAEKALFMAGWLQEPLDEYDQQYYRKWAHEIPPLKHASRGTILDLHHNIIPIVSGKAPDISHLTNQVRHTESGFQVLSPAAMTLHSIVHLFFNEDYKNGFRDLLDLSILIRQNASDTYWQNLYELSVKTKFEFELYLTLRYLKSIINVQLPHLPSAIKQKLALKKPKHLPLLDFIFNNVLRPSHPIVKTKYYWLADLLATLRGHLLKMPLHILIFHLVCKGFKNITQYLLGSTFFLKEDHQDKKF